MADIFLSYAKEDQARAKTFAELLESCGWSVFWDHNIKAADDWRERLQSELDAAGAVVVLWSRTSVGSTWVHEEAERGRSRLVSVRIDDIPLPLGFSHLQAIDLAGWRGGKTAEVEKLLQAVAERVHIPPKPPTIPRSPSQKLRITAGTALCAAALAAYPAWRWWQRPAPIMNQEIVIDTSSGMKDGFDRFPTKLQAAIDGLGKRNLHPDDNLALRQFGGICHDEAATRVLVPFGTRRRGRIVDAASRLQPAGEKATLVSAVLSALADMQPLPHTRRVIVLTGHADACEEEPVREIRNQVEAYKKEGREITLEMRLIGMAVSAKDQSQLQQISDAVGGQAFFVNTADQLNAVLDYVLVFEPAVTHVRAVWDVVGQVGQSMTSVATHMNGRRFDEAEKILKAGQDSYEQMRPSFEALAGQQPSVLFQRFYTLAAENRSLQAQAFDVGSEAIAQGKASGEEQSPEYRASVGAWNALVGKYNANIGEMNRLTDEIVKEARKRG